MERKIYSKQYRKFHVFFRNIFRSSPIFQWVVKKPISALQTDPLTGIYNQFAINSYLKELTPNPSLKYSIILLNIDNYIEIQNYHGIKAAKIVLKKTAELLSINVRQTDLVGRYGENEFIMILSNIDLDDAHDVAQRCLDVVRDMNIQFDSHRIEINASCGVSVSEQHLMSDDVLQYADRALFLAKSTGLNQVCDQRTVFA